MAEPGPAEGPRVLLVDDDAGNVALLRETLEAEGLVVVGEATDGPAGPARCYWCNSQRVGDILQCFIRHDDANAGVAVHTGRCDIESGSGQCGSDLCGRERTIIRQ